MNRPTVASTVLACATTFAAMTVVCAAQPASAQSAGNLAGTWNGGGRVVLSTGNTERARCRATFRRQTARTFSMNATCATPSARAAQVGQLQQVSPNDFRGRFYNREYDISGTIGIVVRGNRLTATLRGAGASANLSLSR